ncbi:MAG: hypothetical protein R3E01_36340 [Pirellulaceae bacterium]|nr:hypothetical protein [Planctomycetales bacterium]
MGKRKRGERLGDHQHRMEAGMSDDEWIVTLRDGTRLDARIAVAELATLKMENARHPDVVEELYAIAQGESVETSPEIKATFFMAGELHPTFKALLISGATRVATGIAFGDPFEHNDRNDHILQTIKENEPIQKKRFVDELFRESTDDRLPPRS